MNANNHSSILRKIKLNSLGYYNITLEEQKLFEYIKSELINLNQVDDYFIKDKDNIHQWKFYLIYTNFIQVDVDVWTDLKVWLSENDIIYLIKDIMRIYYKIENIFPYYNVNEMNKKYFFGYNKKI